MRHRRLALEALVGRVLTSSLVAACSSHRCMVGSGRPVQIWFEEYSVVLDSGVEFSNIPEDCLEELEAWQDA